MYRRSCTGTLEKHPRALDVRLERSLGILKCPANDSLGRQMKNRLYLLLLQNTIQCFLRSHRATDVRNLVADIFLSQRKLR